MTDLAHAPARSTIVPSAMGEPTGLAEWLDRIEASIGTPYYFLDVERILKNLEILSTIRDRSGARFVLALKAFATWGIFPSMAPYLDGTTSSSPFEARLGHETIGKEVHAYSVAFSDDDLEAILPYATKIIFNSTSQLERFAGRASDTPVGIRVNPGVSSSAFELANPAGRFSRLGVRDAAALARLGSRVSGAMFHCNCENGDIASFEEILGGIADTFTDFLHSIEWVSLGGGIAFTRPDYPIDRFAELLRDFSRRFGVQVYLEPGDAIVSNAGYLVTRVLDVVQNDATVAIVDAGVEAHFLDLLVYPMRVNVALPASGEHRYIVAGRSCLAGDVFGTYGFAEPIRVGDRIVFGDAAQYTVVKKNWFNGLAMPAIAVRWPDGRVEVLKTFTYEDYRASLS